MSLIGKPILFNTEMVRALLDGRKTVTRRVVKGYPLEHLELDVDDSVVGVYNMFEGRVFPVLNYAPYKPGDILYVRETWWKLLGPYIYKADQKPGMKNPGKWRPSIHMPREAARIFLRVTGVRVERLQACFTEPICPILELQSEGIDIGETCRECIENYGEPCCADTVDEDGTGISECGILDEVRGDFSRLWDSTIKPAEISLYGWAANPWVWVIGFERISKEEQRNGNQELHI